MPLPLMFGVQVVTRLNALDLLRKEMQKGRTRALKESAKEVQQEAKRLMTEKAQGEMRRAANPVKRDTRMGRFTSGGAAEGRSTGRSKPGELPRSDTGNYRSSIKYTVKRALAFVGSSQPKGAHAGMLKWGTKKMQPRLVPAQEALQRLLPRLTEKYADLF